MVEVVPVMKLWTVIPAALMLSACLSHPPPSPAPYRAIGQEPGWTLIIDEQDLTFIAAGAQPIRQPKPPVIVGFAGEIYQTPRIGVNIVHAPCNDVMSGQGYRDRVQVDVDGKPVGLLYVGVVGPKDSEVREHNLRGAREDIRQRATQLALIQLRDALIG